MLCGNEHDVSKNFPGNSLIFNFSYSASAHWNFLLPSNRFGAGSNEIGRPEKCLIKFWESLGGATRKLRDIEGEWINIQECHLVLNFFYIFTLDGLYLTKLKFYLWARLLDTYIFNLGKMRRPKNFLRKLPKSILEILR